MTLSDPLAGITPSRFDEPILGAVQYLRTALLSEPEVEAHVLELADLYDEARKSPRGTQVRWRCWQRYWRARDESLLREQFSEREIDEMCETARELVVAGVWGLLVPFNQQGAGYGRQKTRARAMSPDSIELAVADFVHRLSGRRAPHLDDTVTLPSTIRKVRQRVRQLPKL